MEKRDVSVATMTWARDREEERVLRAAVARLAGEGLPVMISDGGSRPAFLDFLRGFPVFRVFEFGRAGVLAQIRRSLNEAASRETPFVLYTESDKKVFFESFLGEFISGAADEEGVGVVVAARSESSFATFPEFQQFTETTINRLCAEVTGERMDFTYGPFLMRRELVPYLDPLAEEVGWGWRPYIFSIARRLGYRIVQRVADLPCPPAQRADDGRERLYRMRQLGESVEGLLLSTGAALERAGRPTRTT